MGNDKPSIKNLANRLYGSFNKLNMGSIKAIREKGCQLIYLEEKNND